MIDKIVSREARLEIVPRDPGKPPRVFEIHDLVMRGLGDGGGATFEAALTNPKPHGRITTHGTFGPWRSDDPARTPVRGEYVFKDANLDTIKGIAGTLSSTGAYSGVLERIEVEGRDRHARFRHRSRRATGAAHDPISRRRRRHERQHLSRAGRGASSRNGDSRPWRRRADRDVKGRRVTLDVAIENGRIEDVLKLAVKSDKALMTGRMRLKTKFLLPAGDEDVIDKLELDGTFRLDEARFTNINVQQRINMLSQRGQGELHDEGPSVVSKLSGRFVLRNGVLDFADSPSPFPARSCNWPVRST